MLNGPGSKAKKSTTCANLGVALAQANKSTLIIDCDFQNPAIHESFGLSNASGIADVVAEEQELQAVWKEPHPGLKVVPVGPALPNLPELLNSPRLSEVLDKAREDFDYVLVNGPPGGLASDAAVLAPQEEDGVLFILDAQKKAPNKGSLRQTVRSLKAVGANVLGAVIDRANVEELSERETTEGHQEGVESQQGEVEKQQATKKNKRPLLEFAIMLLVSFAVLFGVIKPFIVEAFYVPTESMVPTLEVGDRVLANKFIYRFSEPERGDIVVFESADGEMDLIKRVVGLPGDKITVVRGSFYVNDERQREPYVNADLPDESTYGPIWVPEGHIFAMGDNRADSADSRVFGPVPKSNIVGEAFLRVWPPGRLGSLEAPLA